VYAGLLSGCVDARIECADERALIDDFLQVIFEDLKWGKFGLSFSGSCRKRVLIFWGFDVKKVTYSGSYSQI
jgi:hypothetical protein